ncbi:MAG: carbohydrate kinase family protein [Anaerolineae bacterium]
MHIPADDIDLVALGEALIDFISVEPADSLRDARVFEKHQGGSPANLCVNLAKLGGRAAFIGKTGTGAFGAFIEAELRAAGVITDFMICDPAVHTSVIFVTKTTGTPDFEAFRDGDFRLAPDEIDADVIRRAGVIHASMWPISREPSRSAVERAFAIAHEAGRIISFDPNYSRRIWPDYDEARVVLPRLLRRATIVKPSLDDAHRFFGDDVAPEAYIARYHELGPQIVVFTLGREGILLSEAGKITAIPAHKVAVKDATGAGDAFWAGFLAALLDGHPLERCARFAREVVEMKLTRVGPLPSGLDRAAIHARLTKDWRRVD